MGLLSWLFGAPALPKLVDAILSDDLDAVKRHIVSGTDVGVKIEGEGAHPLHFAASAEMVKILIDSSVNVNARDRNGCTPLIHAPAGRPTSVVRLLLANGADVNAATTFGETALHVAALCANLPATQMLLESGAKVNARYRMVPGESGYECLSPKEREYADRHSNGLTALQLAHNFIRDSDTREKIASLLKSYGATE